MRQGTRSVAIYFSDLLLWLSVASFFEVAIVLGAGVLCIMTAGFLFEGMKRNPVVLVLGAAVALGGTFLMFREVRGLVWPLVSQEGSRAGDGTSTSGVPFASFRCAQLAQSMCGLRSSCFWDVRVSKCTDRGGSPPLSVTAQPSPLVPLACSAATRQECDVRVTCYWSVLTGSCQRLRLGKGLLSEMDDHLSNPFERPRVGPNCQGALTQTICLVTGGCRWSAGVCVPAPAKPYGQ